MVHDATGGRRTPARPEADKEKDSAQRAEEDKPKKIVRIQDQQGSENVPNVQTFEVQDLPDALREQLEAYRVGNDETVLELEQEASVYQTQTPEPAISAKERHNLRAIWLLVNDLDVTEGILDGGSSIVAISEACCHNLQLPIDPVVELTMQSANGTVERAIGMARDVPCTLLGGITVLLQMYVLRNAPYNILLGRPFEALLHATIENIDSDTQFITVNCPNTGTVRKIPTHPRGRTPPPSPAQVKGFRG